MALQKQIRWLLRDKYGGERSSEFYADIKRLKAGEPLDYVIGWKEFLGCRIDLSKRPLIPREETEFWVGQMLHGSQVESGMTQVLDIFAGSGCVGVAVLKHWPNSHVTFIDSEEDCVEQIKFNLELNNIPKDRYAVIRADIFSPYPGYKLPFTDYDLIFANPPYVAASDTLPVSVKDHEPRKALYAGDDGLSIIKPFLEQAREYLSLNGKIYMEHDPRQKAAIAKILRRENYSNWKFHQDQFGKWRWVEIISGAADANIWSYSRNHAG